MKIWIACPNLWGGRLFCYGESENESRRVLRLIHEFPRPSTRTKLEDFPDEEDASNDGPPVESPERERKVAHDFMRRIAQTLERSSADYTGLILCAEQHLLAILEAALGPASRKKLLGQVPVDLYEANESDLMAYVADFAKDAEAVA